MNTPQFPDFKYIEIKNFKTEEICQLWRVDKMKITEGDYNQIQKICNEEAVYNWLFKENLEGRPYPIEKAKGFIDWSIKGWNENTHFVFIVRDPQENIVAAVDTKSNNLDSAEFGYWATSDYSGIMTNTVLAMIELDKQAGFKSLYAKVRKGNEKSHAVQKRIGTKLEKEFIEEGKKKSKYILKLK